MNDIFPQYKGPNGRITVSDYNALVRAVRRATPQPGPGIRVTRGEGGALITATGKKGGVPPAAQEKLYPFKLKVVNEGTESNPDYRYLVYVPEGSLYCSGVKGNCSNTRYQGDWYYISLDKQPSFAIPGVEEDIYVVGRFAYATDDHALVVSATFTVTTNSDERYVSGLGEYRLEDNWRYYKCLIGTMTDTGVKTQLVNSSLVFMAPTDNQVDTSEVPFEVREVGEVGSAHFIVYLPPDCVSMKGIACALVDNTPYTITDADRERYTFVDTANWYTVLNPWMGSGGLEKIQLHYWYDHEEEGTSRLYFRVRIGTTIQLGTNSTGNWMESEEGGDEVGGFTIADTASGAVRQIAIGAVQIYRQNFSTAGEGEGDGLTEEEKEALKDEIKNDLSQEYGERFDSIEGDIADLKDAVDNITGEIADEVLKDVKDQIDTLTETVNTAQGNANLALGTANSALENANAASNAASSALEDAQDAVDTIANASSDAARAEAAANTATQTAQSAVATANGALETANSANAAAQSAQDRANAVQGQVDTYVGRAEAAANAAENSASAAAGSVGEAAGYADAAAGSASEASGFANDAAQSASDAAASAAEAEAAKDAADGAQAGAEAAQRAAEGAAESAGSSAEAAADAAEIALNAADGMTDATNAANQAAENANEAAEGANTATENANTATENANTAAENANAAAENANGAAEGLTYEALLGVMQEALMGMLEDGSLDEALGDDRFSEANQTSQSYYYGGVMPDA